MMADGSRDFMAGKQDGKPALVWFRQDLRLADNPSLRTAASSGRAVLAVYILDDAAAGAWPMGGAHRWWLHHSLTALAADLKAIGGTLVLRKGSAAEIIPDLVHQTGAAEVHAGSLVEPWARRQADAVAKALGDKAELVLHRASTLLDLDAVRTKTGSVYGIYTPFARACRALGAPPAPLPAPKRIEGLHAKSDKLDHWALLPTHPDWAGGMRETWTPGEAGAHARMQHFMADAIGSYAEGRNIPGRDLTSMLSPHLHWGELSPVQVWHAATQAGSGGSLDTFQNEILWHEFSAYLLWHHPHLPDQPLRPDYARLRWRKDAAGLHAWQRGQTGIPIVDAGMRQLWHVGWMHNRVRMITASFLVKHLLVSWVEGEAWFWDTLVDGDLAANSASWQWIAGCGTDSQPFFRVFNPVTQGEKFDPDGAYVRHWVPELAALPDKHLHAPWDAPPAVLAKAGVTLGKTYPAPILSLPDGRDRALAAFKAMRTAA